MGLLGRIPRAGIFPLWFLSLASLLDADAHPLPEIGAGGYFPGRSTSPLLGAIGAERLMVLTRASRPAQNVSSD